MFERVWRKCIAAYNTTKRAVITVKNVTIDVTHDITTTARECGVQLAIMYRAYNNNKTKCISDVPWYDSM